MTVRPVASVDLKHVLHGTRELWEQMRGQRLFLTGGTGFFGCWLMETFCSINRALRLDAEVWVLTRNEGAFRDRLPHVTSAPGVTLLQGDMADFRFPQGEFRFVIHAAAAVNTRQEGAASAKSFSSILAATERMLDFAATHGTRKFLFTSSGAVYGPQPSALTHVPETYLGAPDPLNPRSLYSEAKRASELMCALSQADGYECKIARCWTFCGPHLPLDANYAIGNFIGDVLQGKAIQISGDGTARRSYLYAGDLAIWLWTILFRAPPLVPVHVGSAEDRSILELAELVGKTLGSSRGIQLANHPEMGAAVSRYVPSIERAAALLGLSQQISLEEGIRRTAAWHGWEQPGGRE